MKQKSKYAQKRDAGNQMYGPGCCAHNYPESKMVERRRIAAQIQDAERRSYFARKAIIELQRDCVPSFDRFMGRASPPPPRTAL